MRDRKPDWAYLICQFETDSLPLANLSTYNVEPSDERIRPTCPPHLNIRGRGLESAPPPGKVYITPKLRRGFRPHPSHHPVLKFLRSARAKGPARLARQNRRSHQRINLLLRTDVEPTSLTSAVRAQIAALNKDQAVFNVRTMDDIVSQSVAPGRFSMMLLTVFAVAALLLASIGIYGTMSYAVAHRTREIGLPQARPEQPVRVTATLYG